MAANDQQQTGQKESREPAHHARRPMNAFLIFCKRHRKSVRKHFPHLENRAVTRVLGEWWATLHPDQKQSYINLAQEYKDAFLNANPDFKWYKLPAPPLRTLTTRPTNKKSDVASYDTNSDTSSSNYHQSSICIDMTTTTRNEDAIQPGKLADESQIGGLSSLFTPQKIQIKNELALNNEDDQSIVSADGSEMQVPKPPKKLYTELEVGLEQKHYCKADLFGDETIESDNGESNNNNNIDNNNEQQHLNEEEEDKMEDGRYVEENITLVEDNNGFRGERSCKGLRYQKFLAEQIRNVGPGTQQQAKRRRITGINTLTGMEKQSKERRNSMSSNVSEKTDSLSSEGGNSTRSDLEHLVDSAEGKVEASKPEDTDAEHQQEYGQWLSRKRFKAEDFNLEKKIEALPSLSLEEFQEKKKQQRTKKKKTLQKLHTNSTSKSSSTSENVVVNTLLVGSRKRKARKQSITRNASATVSKSSVEGANQSWCASPDLEALACLAELAANRTKLTK